MLSDSGLEELLPELVHLRMHISNIHPVFLSAKLKQLTLSVTARVNPESVQLLRRKIGFIWARSPNIEVLRIDGDHRLLDFQNELAFLCQNLQSLRRVILSPAAVTSPVIKALACLEKLEAVDVAEFGRGGERVLSGLGMKEIGSVDDLENLREGSFKNLREFGIICHSLRCAATMLSSGPNVPWQSLESLWIRFPTTCERMPHEVRAFLSILVDSTQCLRRLTIRLADYDSSPFRRVEDIRRLRFQDIEPFLRIMSLVEFAIDDTFPLDLCDDDVSCIGGSASRFTLLWLNPFPTLNRGEVLGIPVSSLEYFARGCPALLRLGVRIDGSSGLSDWPVHDKPQPFVSLKELFLGWSFIPSMEDDDSLTHWFELAILHAWSIPPWTAITTILDYYGTDPDEVVCGPMRACRKVGWYSKRCLRAQSMALRAVFGLAQCLRFKRESMESGSL